jgi:ABC-type sugar transport system, periplasmic component
LGACTKGDKGNVESNISGSDSVKQEQSTSGTQQETTEQKKVSLRYYTASANDKQEFDAYISEWNKANPNIAVECIVISGDDVFGKIRTAIAGGEPVDVVQMESETFRDKASSLYYKLNDLMAKDGFNYLDAFGEYGRATMVKDDIYGISKVLSPACVYVNMEYLNKAGISLPDENTWTFDDYFDLIKKLTVKDAKGKVSVYGGVHWQSGFTGGLSPIYDLALLGGWDIVTEDGKPNVNDPVLKAAAQKYLDAMFVDKTMPTIADITANKMVALFDLCKGNVASIIGASNSALFFDVYKVQGYLTEEKDAKNEIKILKLPRYDSKSQPNRINTIVTSYAVTASTKYPEEAYKFLKWHCTDGLVLASKVSHRVPAWKGADETTLVNNWRFYNDKDGNLTEGKDRKDIYLKALDKTLVPVFFQNRFNYSYSSMFLDELKKELSIVMAGEKDLDTALNSAQKACEAIYEKEKGK